MAVWVFRWYARQTGTSISAWALDDFGTYITFFASSSAVGDPWEIVGWLDATREARPS
jgi:hypothetical protein